MNEPEALGTLPQHDHEFRSLLAGRHLHVETPDAELFNRSFKIRAAESARERQSASALVSRMYATRGYQTDTLSAEKAPEIKTFLATDHNEPIGTLSIHLDSHAGLQVDQTFLQEVDCIRASGMRVCEFTKLAMDRLARSPRLLASLFHVAYIYAHRIMGVDELLIEVNPRHVRYYQSMLGFKVVGSQRHNGRVGASAVLLALEMSFARQQIESFGGRPEMASIERSAYPYFFSRSDEEGVIRRLGQAEVILAHVVDPAPSQARSTGSNGHTH